ncbi:hypothetical protein C8A03DRAFT_16976 [Achaetomium macrosporum]|uniref:Uncharacterized protein n=1 Tax=Achaetomium macrosporum TaxID=79813 RepID=A0AAN7C7H9_9PEZI|nr:hypothetical protein C8A03DRAFT_16976 [Achaetomium macrosporum]
MTFPRGIVIPSVFGWLLLVQAPLVAISIYALGYISGVRTVPIVLVVVTTSLHCLLGVYCCATRAKARSYHIYIVNPWLVVCAGLWCGALYYFARGLRSENTRAGPDQRLLPWTKAGCAMSSLGMLFDFLLLGVFNRSVLKQTAQQQPKDSQSSSASTPVSALPPQVRLLPLRHSTPNPDILSPQPIQHPPLSKLFPRQQHSLSVSPLPTTRQQQQQPEPPDPDSEPEPEGALLPKNRITLILALCNLQHPDGHWPYTPQLAAVLRVWAGGRGEVAVASRGVTALAHACLTDLAHYVWRAQREGREYEMLSAAELVELERVGWDLKWVAGCIAAAGRWLCSCQGGSDERGR